MYNRTNKWASLNKIEYADMTPGISRIKNFLEDVNNPHDKIKVIHIAGSNGKGSTATFISEILKTSGYKTALYTSPHLTNITERFKINNENISLKVLNNLLKKYSSVALKYSLSFFEYMTALAFIYFEKKKVDIAVFETGLGGRFDATNVINNPLICIITSITKEHQEILGTTIRKITIEKTGIIKKDTYIVCGKLPTESIFFIKNKFTNEKIYLYGENFKFLNNATMTSGQIFNYISDEIKIRNIKINLLGEHQVINASVAICVANLLNKMGYFLINKISIKKGLENTILYGRFDIREVKMNNKNFKMIIDGAHNVQGVKVFIKTLKQLDYTKKRRNFIFTVMKEKKYKYMIKYISPFVKKIILPHINNNRAVKPNILSTEFNKYVPKNKIYIVNSVKIACDMIETSEIVIVLGSFYLVGEVLSVINNLN
jgi:dihydrofolate synthase/folylpolyglutamate synthase